ncbi:dihydrolipoyllysine-residue acetyltransferase component of pyruvate dehydrogenase complex, mitochondrial-like [Xenia sp. Carnegie-2017]|uniref:dihydrolipoyllysine-residue acetyltransferase component of pyruvate dehydrogenase complex, mitochondrial-like n=1 Tax=Xenia sp. Carnegie-2017 TaxID=2897299 RepID=UPI001F03C1A6|nr:dihydrolipoyllysine-residue acetyltransferase component of pyruvate dehydrogenase complex, mitochondrial-like [Xenia sp. Carnegie-2017]
MALTRNRMYCIFFDKNIVKNIRVRSVLLSSPSNVHYTLINGTTVKVSSLEMSLIGPSVRRLLDSYGLDRNIIKATGEKGQLLKGDVLKHIHENSMTEIKFKAKTSKETLPSSNILQSNIGYVDFSISTMQQDIARKLTESKNKVPHLYNMVDCKIDNLLRLCEKFDEPVSIYDFFIKAVGLALHCVPMVNAIWSNNGPISQKDINVAIMVNSPVGTLAPILQKVHELDVVFISQEVLNLKEKAMNGFVDTSKSSSFAVSTLENTGVKSFTGILEPAHSALLTVGDCQKLVGKDKQLSNIVHITLCTDARVIDNQLASKWLTVFKEFVENPFVMAL